MEDRFERKKKKVTIVKSNHKLARKPTGLPGLGILTMNLKLNQSIMLMNFCRNLHLCIVNFLNFIIA